MKRFLSALMLGAMLSTGAQAQPVGEALGFAVLQSYYEQGQGALISPWGLGYALNMAAEGAKGDTRKELLTLLNATAPAPQSIRAQGVSSAAAALFDPSCVPLDEYRQALAGYGARCFEALSVDAINLWAKEATEGMIDPLMTGPLPENARLALLSALALDAKWQRPFSAGATADLTFHAPDGDVTCPFMRRTGRIEYGAEAGLEMARLPYKAEGLACYLLLPPEGEMARALKTLQDKGFSLFEGLAVRQVSLSLPKLALDSGLDLSGPLRELGLSLSMSNGADFSGIDGTNALKLGAVLQRSRLDMDEDGTRAASATAAVMVKKSALPMPATDMTLDRPFVLLIRDELANQTLFAACVLNPEKTGTGP